MEDTDKNKTAERNNSWFEANQNYIRSYLELLRVLLHRRILWLRKLWQHNPMPNISTQVISDAQADWLLKGENYPAEWQFYKEDPNAQKITKAVGKVKHDLHEQSKELWKSGIPTALDALAQIFGLTESDRILIMICIAPEIDISFERLYAYVQDDISRKYVTAHLAASLLESDPELRIGLKQSLLPGSPLFKYKLIERDTNVSISTGWNNYPLRINHRITDYLNGINRIDENAENFLEQISKVKYLPQSYQSIADKLASLTEMQDTQLIPSAINLTGPAITAKLNIASKLCEIWKIELYKLDLKQVVASIIRVNELTSLLERECLLLPAAIYIEVPGEEENNDPVKVLAEKLIERFGSFFFIGSREPFYTIREMFHVQVPKLNIHEQTELWKHQLSCKNINLEGNINILAEQFDFETDMVEKSIAAVSIENRMRDGKNSSLKVEDLWKASREQSRNDLEGLAQRLRPCFGWEDIVLPQKILEQLYDIASQVENRAVVYEKWGYGVRLNRGRGISALFSGVSGTGKTMAAEILAGHLNLDLYRIDLSAVVSKYIGETEKNLRKVFDAAEQSGAILFFDEADALFGKRTEVKDSHDRYANIEINYLLQRMEDYRGLAILATNMKSLLDQSFLRRLRFHVEFPFPDSNYRELIWKKSFPPQTEIGDLDYNFLRKLEIPGGNIKNISLNAAFLAAADGQVINMEHIFKATKREYAKIGKMVLQSEFGSYYESIIS